MMPAYKLQLENAGWMGDLARGAQMGRPDTLPDDPNAGLLLHLHLLTMSSGRAYDAGGAYWGAGSGKIGFMYCAETHDADPEAEYARLFIRARSRSEAKAQILKRLPNARFYRAPLDAVTEVL